MGFLEEIRATDSMPPKSGPPTMPGRVGQWQFPTKERVSLRGWQLSMMAHEGSVLVLWLAASGYSTSPREKLKCEPET